MKLKAANSAILEIGVEEIPARFMAGLLDQFQSKLSARLKERGVENSSIDVWGTPRRLALLIHGLPDKAEDRMEEIIGPPLQAAKDSAGHWTAAALGFAKTQKVPVDKLQLRQTAKGERFVVLHSIKGEKTESLLKEIFPQIIQALNFPKSMIWEPSLFRFPRPLRWIVALYNSRVIRFKMAGVASDKNSVGLLALGGRKVPISKPEKYKSLLQGRCILVDPKEREKNIRSQIETISKRIKANPILADDHIQEVVYLTEYPVSILGHFPEAYLNLPREVLVSVLKKHQKFFPLESLKGQLTHSFIGVRNGPSESQEEVREGYERVINARLSDAQFFFAQDSKTPLDELVSRLSGVGFVEKMGTLHDKTGRVRELVGRLGRALSLDESILQDADRSAFLAKADLLTQMVSEFPELQGVAGRFYGQKSEKPDVARAIEQHYWPLSSEGALPETDMASLVALADKLDSLAAHFFAGLIPTGSADPYALRRLALGVIRILIERKWRLSLERLIDSAYDFQSWYGTGKEKAREELKKFFLQRCFNWFTAQGYRPDEVEAVLASEPQSPYLAAEKLKGFKAVRSKTEFLALAAAIKRARNILQQAKEKKILPDQHVLQQDQLTEIGEKTLYDALNTVRPRLSSALGRLQYQEALLELATLKDPVDDFFKGVMVMVEDQNVRNQRLALLMSVKELFDQVADFAKLQGVSAN